jgi:hypothetical protein
MSVQTKDRIDPVLPSDVTPRVRTFYRRHGVIASLLASIVAVGANYRLDRAHGRYKSGYAPPVPDHLRQDIGLAPLPPKLPEWWEQRW